MLEETILSGLVTNEDYTRKVLPFIRKDYFDIPNHQIVFDEVSCHFEKYNSLPSKQSLLIAIDNNTHINEEMFKEITALVKSLDLTDKKTDWLVDTTEKFCQDKAIYNAVRESISILDGQNKKLDKGAIPSLLSEALGVSFDGHVGHDFIEDASSRYDFYHLKEDRVAFDLEMFNKITRGGLSKKSLSVIMAGTGVGKTMLMTHMASANLAASKNVLYITMEMAEEKIAERIDANLLDLTIEQLYAVNKTAYEKRMERFKAKTEGKLIIKEYPTATASTAHFRALLNELRLKRDFIPDIIYIDYLNICASSRIKYSANVNSYTYIKSIAEEIRGLAVEFELPVVTATQVNRTGFNSSDIDLENTSESFGLPATADFMVALISSEDLDQLGQVMVKQLKNRWNDLNYHRRFVIGVDRSKMTFYDVEESAQEDIMHDGPIMDKTNVHERVDAEKPDLMDKFQGLQ